jgi:hypothetical protein
MSRRMAVSPAGFQNAAVTSVAKATTACDMAMPRAPIQTSKKALAYLGVWPKGPSTENAAVALNNKRKSELI